MLSPESLQVQSYLFTNKTAQGAPASLAEQSAWFDMIVEKLCRTSDPLSEGTPVELVKSGGIPGVDLSPCC